MTARSCKPGWKTDLKAGWRAGPDGAGPAGRGRGRSGGQASPSRSPSRTRSFADSIHADLLHNRGHRQKNGFGEVILVMVSQSDGSRRPGGAPANRAKSPSKKMIPDARRTGPAERAPVSEGRTPRTPASPDIGGRELKPQGGPIGSGAGGLRARCGGEPEGGTSRRGGRGSP